MAYWISTVSYTHLAAGACPVGAFQTVIGSSKFRFSYSITGILILFGVMPVSYTHLDVYKRQAQGDALAAQHHADLLLGADRSGAAVPAEDDHSATVPPHHVQDQPDEMCIRDSPQTR